jgi:hypothetical protein
MKPRLKLEAPPPAAAGTGPEAPVALPIWLYAGPLLLFLSACAFGMLEVHSSTDTWIGLAAGRDILASPAFPLTDSWTYTFAGQTWFNQNWLCHVYFWLLYLTCGPDAVVYGTWALSVGTFVLVLAATRLRCGSWLAATLAASVVAISCRDWFSARPATAQFFLLALLWCCLSALLTGAPRHRWWPIALLAPLFGVWTHAHGSFVFGFGLVVMFLGAAVVPIPFGRRAVIDVRQAGAMLLIVAVTAVLGAVLSPYGLDNYTHPLKVAQSEVFRTVGEWSPPYRGNRFPPVTRFWLALALAIAAPLLAWVLRRIAPRRDAAASDTPRVPWLDRVNLHALVFDVASVVLGLYMAMFARRFAPIFYILATPAMVTMILHLARGAADAVRARTRLRLVILTWPAFVCTAAVTARLAYQELVREVPAGREFDLLERVTAHHQGPLTVLEFLQRNALTGHLMCEWTVAGTVTFETPGMKTFIDGRSQQVFTARHYTTYLFITGRPEDERGPAGDLLARFNTEAVLLRHSRSCAPLRDHLLRHPDWAPILQTEHATLFVRRDAPLMTELVTRERTEQLWWPDTALADFSRGRLLVAQEPFEIQRALTWWMRAVERDLLLGRQAFEFIAAALGNVGQLQRGIDYFDAQAVRVRDDPELSVAARTSLTEQIARLRATLEEQRRRESPP